MNIKKYAGYFHDGTIHDIQHVNNIIIISMESAELRPKWNEDNIKLSKYNTISGNLHLKNVRKILINDKPYNDILEKTYDSSDVYRLKIQSNKAILLVSWINYPPNPPEETDIFTIEIEAEKITWENVPNLFESLREI